MKIVRKFKATATRKNQIDGTILGIPVNGTSRPRLLDILESSLEFPSKLLVVTPNPEIILLAQKDGELRKALQSADFSVPDGIGIIWAGKLLAASPELQLIKGRELMLDLLKIANSKNKKVFLLGSTDEVIEKSINRIRKDYPHIKVLGLSGPQLAMDAKPLTKKDIALYTDAVNEINNFMPDMLFVAFGAPKQEKWLYENLGNLTVKLAMTVGGSLNYFANTKPLPPNILASRFEWLWRLFNEPGHYKRVYRALFLFPLAVIREKLKI